MENYTGRKVAIDASMAMYQFLVAVRSSGTGGGYAAAQLVNEAGEVTSHIQGMFNRTIKMMSCGIKPVYVFDGKPPQMKSGELALRMAKRAKAELDLAAAQAAEDVEDVDKFSRRLVKVSRQHNEDCKELLRLMGVPVLTAPCEAEAQCAELARKNKVFATATEDMDALTFRTPKLIRKLTFSQVKGKEKQAIIEIDFQAVLSGLELTYEQFVDLCILCGCDYCSSIKGIGPKTALKLIRAHKNIETILTQLVKDKHSDIPPDWFPQRVVKRPPNEDKGDEDEDEEKREDEDEKKIEGGDEKKIEGGDDEEALRLKASSKDDENSNEQTGEEKATTDGGDVDKGDVDTTAEVEEDPTAEYEEIPPLYLQARQLFINCDVTSADSIELRWDPPDEAALTTFLVDRMGFNPDRVSSGIKRLQEAQVKKAQTRMDSFFTSMPATTSATLSAAQKRKAEEGKSCCMHAYAYICIHLLSPS